MRKLLFLAFALIPFLASAQITAKSLTAANGKKVGFYQFLPSNYGKSTALHPMIISLHGISERGNGTTELSRVLAVGLPKYANRGRTFIFNFAGKTEGFVLLAPQLSSEYGDWQPFYVEEMINYAVKYLKVDPNRIILSGLSLGGGGTWKYPSSSSAAAAKLAAVVPVCGTCAMSNANNYASNNIAVYAFHAKNDTRVSYNCSYNAVNAINAANPKNKALLQSYATGGHVIWDMAYDTGYAFQNPNVFEWMLGQNKALAPNKMPVANAGNAITISTSTATVTLSGSGSDADGSIVRYIWKKISGPAAGIIKSAGSNTTVITSLTTAGTYVYELKVVDNRGGWATDQVTVNVTTGTVTANKAPVANAGADKSITLPTSSTTLSGSATDADGSIASYAWTKISGPAGGSFSSTTSASTTISGLTTAGTYVLRLTVKDNAGATDYDDVSVTVNAATTTSNAAPVANAGSNKTITLPTSSATLTGSATDADGTIASYAWTKISGPAGGSFSSTTTASTTISNLTTAGTYVLRLTVKDNDGATDYDDVSVVVNAATTSNAAPIARAGNDANLTTSTHTLDGSSSSDDKGIIKSSWTQLAGPATVSYTDRYALRTAMNGMTVAGQYRFRLRVWDAEGVIDVDDVTINVGSSTGTSGGGSTSTTDKSTSTSSESVTINPNPVTRLTANCYVSSATNGSIKIQILTTGGTLISEVNYLKTVTDYKVGLNVSNLAAGTYVVKVLINGTKQLSTQMVRQ